MLRIWLKRVTRTAQTHPRLKGTDRLPARKGDPRPTSQSRSCSSTRRPPEASTSPSRARPGGFRCLTVLPVLGRWTASWFRRMRVLRLQDTDDPVSSAPRRRTVQRKRPLQDIARHREKRTASRASTPRLTAVVGAQLAHQLEQASAGKPLADGDQGPAGRFRRTLLGGRGLPGRSRPPRGPEPCACTSAVWKMGGWFARHFGVWPWKVVLRPPPLKAAKKMAESARGRRGPGRFSASHPQHPRPRVRRPCCAVWNYVE